MTASHSESRFPQARFPQGIRFPKALAAAGLAAVLVGCGGGSSDTPMDKKPDPMTVALPTSLPSNLRPAAETLSIAAGESRTSGGVMFSCAPDGDPCEVTIGNDGTVMSTGGAVTPSLTTAAQQVVVENKRTAERADVISAITKATNEVTGITDESTNNELMSAQDAVDEAKDKLEKSTALTQADETQLQKLIDGQQEILNTKKESHKDYSDKKEKEQKEARTKTGEQLYKALGNPDENDENMDALDNIGALTLNMSGLVIDAAAGAGTLPSSEDPVSVTLEATDDSVEPLGGWNGKHYAHTDSGTKIKNEARVYTNQAKPTSQSFEKWVSGTTGIQIETTAGTNKGSIEVRAADLERVRVDVFLHQGTQNHPFPSGSTELFVRGTYNGASGRYRCTGTCSSTNDGEGSPSALGGTWRFFPDSDARVSTPDADYLYYGWWVSKDKDGMPEAASAFAGTVGTVGIVDNFSNLNPAYGWSSASNANGITGSATYTGNAVGKFAINDHLNGTGDGGHFTADAKLKAKFGSHDAGNGVTGTIDNFRLNDGSEDPGWSVKLNNSSAWADDGVVTGTDTVWSIDGNEADSSGEWGGTMYDETPGVYNKDTAPYGDGSNIPTTVTGRFYSEFHDNGRMVGAFGAQKED